MQVALHPTKCRASRALAMKSCDFVKPRDVLTMRLSPFLPGKVMEEITIVQQVVLVLLWQTRERVIYRYRLSPVCQKSIVKSPMIGDCGSYHCLLRSQRALYSGMCLNGLAKFSWQKGSLPTVQISVSYFRGLELYR